MKKSRRPAKTPAAQFRLLRSVACISMALAGLGSGTSFAGPGVVNCTDPLCGTTATIPTYYANSPKLQKFVDTLPKLGAPGTAGNYIPLAVPDTTTYPGSNYFVIGAVEYTQRMHRDLPKETTLRGYVQLYPDGAARGPSAYALSYPDGKPIVWPGTTHQVYAYDKPHYLGPVIATAKGTAVRVKFHNFLPLGRATETVVGGVSTVTRNGDIFLPVDESLGGAGKTPGADKFTQNRIAIHLHGGDSPWISDGTPHQWFVPAGEPTAYKMGASFANVPDMPHPGDGAQTLYWPNHQSARFIWYHDHSFGQTRQNVYAGMASAYWISDAAEDAALFPAGIETLPLVIQDKTFVPPDIAAQDAKWDSAHWGQPGDLWLPHVYEPNILIDPADPAHLIPNPAGRWDFGATDPFAPIIPHLGLPDGSYGQVSTTPEMYVDTPVINGMAYPTLTVSPKAYRIKFLNASNDRYVNLSLWVADPSVPGNTEVKMIPEPPVLTGFTLTSGGSNYVQPVVTIVDPTGTGATASATVQGGVITAITLNTAGSGYSNPSVLIADAAQQGAGASATPTTFSRPGGIPDPATAGPSIIQLGNETGLLPAPVVHKARPMQYDATYTETGGGFYLANAERGDTVIDFSAYAGKTLILYNDSSAPVPAGDPRYDYYTANGSQANFGGAPATEPGFGPNTRTLMQIVVKPTGGAPSFDAIGNGGPLATTLPATFLKNADALIEPRVPASQLVLDSAANTLTFPGGTPKPLLTKTIEGGFDANFGRLIANFGTDVIPGANGSTALGYIDPPTEVLNPNETQYWRIKNHDGDNHPIHFHLFNVQLIARVASNGSLKDPLPHEMGWKDVVQAWPGEELIVAMRPTTPVLPFGIPNSVRLLDPTMPAGTNVNTALSYPSSPVPFAFTQFDLATGAPKDVTNTLTDFGWEYVWHCHILGHEENDLMRPIVFKAPMVAPGAPTNVSLSAGVVSWTDASPAASAYGQVNNEIGFRVERTTLQNGQTGTWSALPSSDLFAFPGVNTLANAVKMADTQPLPANTDVQYRVVAVNQAGEAPSAVFTLTALPAAPAGLAATTTLNPGNNTESVNLQWQDLATNEKAYTVSRNGVVIATLPANSTTYTDTLVGASTVSTSYTVSAVNAKGSSSSAAVLVSSAAKLVAPAALSATSVVTPRSVNLSWIDQSFGETGYAVSRATARVAVATGAITWSVPVALNTARAPIAANAVGFSDATVVADTIYQYSVGPLNGTVQGPQASVLGHTAATPLLAPTKMQAGLAATVSTVSVDWEPSASVLTTGNEIQRCEGTAAVCATGNWVTLPVILAGQTIFRYNDTGLKSKTTYSYRVRAINSLIPSLASPWSTVLALTTR